jgi:hypothetical protein
VVAGEGDDGPVYCVVEDGKMQISSSWQIGHPWMDPVVPVAGEPRGARET